MESIGPYTAECREAAEGRVPRNVDGSRAKSIRVFRSPVLEFLGIAHPVTPALWWSPAIVYGTARGLQLGALRASLLFALGLLTWSLTEYVLHRFLFHMPARDQAGRLRRFMLHWYHHEFPHDSMRLLAPPMMSWSVGAAMWLLFRVTFGATAMWPVFAGCAFGYLVYDYVHYYTHHARPRTAIGKFLRNYHLRHHHEATESRFGVSSPLWDLVFGTYAPVKPKSRAR